jgi:RNA polymerase sigma factor (sigma-70 family)
LGAVGDFSDRQLLERFASGEGELAELAFTALVERHGPMVLRVCTSILHNPHDAQDAFQATLLVLLRKSPGLWAQDSLGPWLHRVARRIAARAQRSTRRRRELERRAAEARTAVFTTVEHDASWSTLHEEIDRLPEKLRVLVVLCHLEGQSQELAAKTLSLPLGTIKSRLHQARSLLRRRLSQRGVRFSPGLLTVEPVIRAAKGLHSLPAHESMAAALARAVSNRADATRLVSARVIQLFEEALKTMFLNRMKRGALMALVAGSLALGAAGVFARQDRPQNESGPKLERGPAGKIGGTATGKAAAEEGGVPFYIRRSRTMIVDRLEQELKLAQERLDLTTANIRSPADPEVLRARKTVNSLAGLIDRIDTVLVDAVEEFPTIFDFSASGPNPGSSAVPVRGRGVDEDRGRAQAPEKPRDGAADPTYDEHSLAALAEKLEWSTRMFEKGFRTQAQRDADKSEYEALKNRIDADIARAQDQVDWAKRMFEKGYMSKHQYDAALLRHYDALKARLAGEEPAVSGELLMQYEHYLKKLHEAPANPALGNKASAKP